METKTSKYDIAIEKLDRIADQLQKGMISKNDYDGQRLIILIELGNAAIKEFNIGE